MASDENIHFPPGQRRDRPSFEPPPWERDQFEELARRKQEEDIRAAGAQPPVEAQGEVRTETELISPALKEAPGAASDAETAAPSPQAEKAGGELDQNRVDVLMLGLRAEEPRPERMYWRIVAGSGVVSALVGLMITTWAVVVIAAPKRAGAGELLFQAMLLLLGLGFVGGGGWVVFRSLRQQGVL